MFHRLLLIGICFAVLAGIGYSKRKEIFKSYKAWHLQSGSDTTPQPEKYALLKQDLEALRNDLAKTYLATEQPIVRSQILQQSRDLLESTLPEMMRCWLGTPWDYSGTSSTPGNGKIACGYYVANILRDGGFQVKRNKLAQQASQHILETFVEPADTIKRIGKPYKTFSQELRGQKPGIYIIGLDTHVGFLVVTEETFHFLHSSSALPFRVVDQLPHQAKAIKRSRYRIYGSFSADNDTLEKWLLGEKFEVKTS